MALRRRLADGGLGRFATTVHVLLSAVLKLMRVVRVPPGLPLYRGLGGRLALPASFEAADGDGLYGYAEWGFLSTTSSREVAVQVRPASVSLSRLVHAYHLVVSWADFVI